MPSLAAEKLPRSTCRPLTRRRSARSRPPRCPRRWAGAVGTLVADGEVHRDAGSACRRRGAAATPAGGRVGRHREEVGGRRGQDLGIPRAVEEGVPVGLEFADGAGPGGGAVKIDRAVGGDALDDRYVQRELELVVARRDTSAGPSTAARRAERLQPEVLAIDVQRASRSSWRRPVSSSAIGVDDMPLAQLEIVVGGDRGRRGGDRGVDVSAFRDPLVAGGGVARRHPADPGRRRLDAVGPHRIPEQDPWSTRGPRSCRAGWSKAG